jgi:DNA-binding NtrC family response regulator
MIEMPSLRRRADDIEELCQHLLQRIAEERGDDPCILSAEAHALLRRHAWPGNVRELENVLRSATLFAESPVLAPGDFAAFAETFRAADPDPEMARAASTGAAAVAPPERIEDMVYDRVRGGERSLFEMKKALERECILRALQETGGNITRAASLLGMKRPRLSQLVKQYGLTAQTSGREGV